MKPSLHKPGADFSTAWRTMNRPHSSELVSCGEVWIPWPNKSMTFGVSCARTPEVEQPSSPVTVMMRQRGLASLMWVRKDSKVWHQLALHRRAVVGEEDNVCLSAGNIEDLSEILFTNIGQVTVFERTSRHSQQGEKRQSKR
jgi:hypothetical protein